MKSLTALRKQNSLLEKQLPNHFKEDYVNMILYLRGANISTREIEQVRCDILGILLEGSQRNEMLTDLIGDDLKQFCDEVIKQLPKFSLKQQIAEFGVTFIMASAILLTIHLVFNKDLISHFLSGHYHNLIITYSWSDLINMLLIIIVSISVVNYMTTHALDQKKPFKKRDKWLLHAAMVLIIGIIIYVTWQLKSTIFLQLPFYWVLLVIVALWLILAGVFLIKKDQ